MILYLDLETRNAVDIKVGTHRYAETADIDLFGYAIGSEPARVWDVASGEPMPEDLKTALLDENVPCVAHNAVFDRTILRHALPEYCPAIERWSCSMVLAYTLGLPGSLEQLGHVLGLEKDEKKHKEGGKLVNKFCKPAPANHI